MPRSAVSHNLARLVVLTAAVAGLPAVVAAGSLRVGPTRLDLSARQPVAVLEVQNTGDTPTLTQLDTFDWTQSGRGDELQPTWNLIATPVVMLRVIDAEELGWRWVPDITGCASVQLANHAARHEHVLSAEMLARNGEVLWRANEPAYVLAAGRRSLAPAVCPPSIKESATLRLSLYGRVVNLPVEAPSLVVDATPH